MAAHRVGVCPVIDMHKPTRFRLHEQPGFEHWKRVSWYSQGIFIALYKFGHVKIPCVLKDRNRMRSRLQNVVNNRIILDPGLGFMTHWDRDFQYIHGRIYKLETLKTVSLETARRKCWWAEAHKGGEE
tara:strand:- start:9699 stop:10082 length:384 start_codon:yes stop_codon:yes gene_type:complete